MHSILEMKQFFLYAFPAMPLALLGLPLYVYLPTYYAQDIQLGIFEVGSVLLVARVFDMLMDPIIGYICDKYLLRKTMMFVGMLFLLSGFYFLTHPSSNANYMWLLTFSLLVYLGWSLVSIPYYTLGADIGKEYFENNRYATFRETFNMLGVLVALLLPYIYNVTSSPADALLLMNNDIFLLLPAMLLLFFLQYTHKVLIKKQYLSLTLIKDL